MSNPEFLKDAMGTVENATNKMHRMLGQLRKGRLEETCTTLVNVRSVLQKVIDARAVALPRPTLTCHESGLVISTDPERLATIIEHIVQNAQEVGRQWRGFRSPWSSRRLGRDRSNGHRYRDGCRFHCAATFQAF